MFAPATNNSNSSDSEPRNSNSPSAPRRILVVRLSAMGDVIHALPAVASLKASFPGSEIVWAVDPKWSVLLEGNPNVDRILPFNRRDWSNVRTSIGVLRSLAFDLAVDFQGLIKSALLASVARAERIFGFARGFARELPATWCYSCVTSPTAAHVVDQNLQLAAAAGARQMVRDFALPPGSPEGTLPDGPFVLASPFAGWASKQWPIEHFAAVAKGLKLPLVVNGPPGSEPALRQIRDSVLHISGIDGLIDATRRAAAVIGVDSGPLHLAAALAKPGVAIFGPTDPARNGPYGGSMTVLRQSGAATTYKRGATIADSMRAISPAQVLEALEERMLPHGSIS